MSKTIHTAAYVELIEWLTQRRKEKGVSMRELAKMLNVSHSMIGKIEKLDRRLDVYEYVRICKYLGIDPKLGIKVLEHKIK